MPILYWFPEPRVAPAKVWAKGSSSSEMNVSWEPVQQDMNGILLGYEVSTNWGCEEWAGTSASLLVIPPGIANSSARGSFPPPANHFLFHPIHWTRPLDWTLC